MPILYLCDAIGREYAQGLVAKINPKDVELFPLPERPLSQSVAPEEGTHLMISASNATIKQVLSFAAIHHCTVGILPLPDQGRLARVLALPKDPDARFMVAATPSEKAVDLLYGNDVLVLGDARIGENTLLKEYEFDTKATGFWSHIKKFVRSWHDKARLRHHRFTLSTDKDETITLSATGLIALNHDNDSLIGRALRSDLSATDGQLALLALAPTSLFDFFVSYPMRLMWRRWRQESALPATWGYLKSSRITVASPDALDVVVDDISIGSTPVTLRVEPSALRLSVGEGFWMTQTAPKATRNTLRLSGVPRDEERMKYFELGLPLFAHASQEEYATLFGALRDETQLNWTFAILLILSTVLATLGLFINSASVIIGAMLLAPLMQPIVGLSMGVLRRDTGLLISGTRSIVVGVGLVLVSAMGIAWMTPIHELGSEMAARLSPTILDLIVAIASGVAAAYAKNNPKISGSLVGVAIAVALVPPLSVAGIGLGWGDVAMFANAMLLFVTNLVGIVFAAALTFFVQGFSPIHIARQGIAIWAGVAILIAIPLYHALTRMEARTQIRQALSQLQFEYNGQTISLGRVEYLPGSGHPQVRCEVIVDRTLGQRERDYLREMIDTVVGRPTDTIVTLRYRL
jgi:uncharacterized hydrophobic protein (TIGR00271 family)